MWLAENLNRGASPQPSLDPQYSDISVGGPSFPLFSLNKLNDLTISIRKQKHHNYRISLRPKTRTSSLTLLCAHPDGRQAGRLFTRKIISPVFATRVELVPNRTVRMKPRNANFVAAGGTTRGVIPSSGETWSALARGSRLDSTA
jgi:hypothetical protein